MKVTIDANEFYDILFANNLTVVETHKQRTRRHLTTLNVNGKDAYFRLITEAGTTFWKIA